MKIYLVRHGETMWNKARKLQGQSDVPLNEYGRKLAYITAEGLKDISFDAVYASPLGRAVETAQIISGDRQIPFTTDERLMEMCFGVEEGADIPAIKKNPKDPLYNFLNKPEAFVPPEKGESFSDIYARSRSFMENIIIPLEEKYDNILLVAHGALNRSILNPICQIPVKDFWQIRLLNCAVSVLSLENGRFSVTQPGKIFYERS